NVKVQFTCSSPGTDKSTAIQVWRVLNTTRVAVPMSEWDLVYWFTADGHMPTGATCDLWNGSPCPPGMVTISLLTGAIALPAADSYMNVHFSAAVVGAVDARLVTLQT